jgi:hypothetical protein
VKTSPREIRKLPRCWAMIAAITGSAPESALQAERQKIGAFTARELGDMVPI